MIERYRSVVTASVAIYDDSHRVLMLRRAPDSYYGAGLWALPAGHIEEGESVRACAVRELREEIGVAVRPDHLVFTDVRSSRDSDGSHRLSFLFRTVDWTGTPTIREPDAHSELCWFDVGNLPSNIVPHYVPWLTRGTLYPAYTEGDWTCPCP